MTDTSKAQGQELPPPPGSMGFFRLRGKSVVHLVLPVSNDGPFSDTAICGTAATKEIPVARHVYGDNGKRIFTGMGSMVFKSVEGWIPSMPPNGVKSKLCKRCHKAHNVIIRKATAAVLNDPVIKRNLENQWEERPQ